LARKVLMDVIDDVPTPNIGVWACLRLNNTHCVL
jgi:hypothetical protein